MAGSQSVGGLLKTGSDENPDLREESRQIAEWLWDWAAPGYGPRGSTKLVVSSDGPGGLIVSGSPATSLREADPAHPGVSPYTRMADSMQATRGDGATTALLLAVALVRRALETDGPLRPLLDGVHAARRQCLAVLSAHAIRAKPEKLLASVVPDQPSWPGIMVAGLRRLSEHGHLDLDAIDVRPEPGNELTWDEGLILEPEAPAARPDRPALRVALVTGVREKTATDATLRIRSPVLGSGGDDRWRQLADRIAKLGVGILLSMKALPEDLRGALLDRDILIQQNLPKPLAWRIQTATGAELVPSPETLTLDDLGIADLRKRHNRRGGWSLHGPGLAATLHVPQATGNIQEARVDDAERLLRAAGAAMEDPRGVPGAGGWHMLLETSVAGMVELMEGRAQLGARAAEHALRDLRHALVRNAGLDPLDVPLPPAPAGLMDGYAVVRDAVDNAFRTADAIIRLDGRYQKRGSAPADLRGGTGPAGSPLGMPGDVPPLM